MVTDFVEVFPARYSVSEGALVGSGRESLTFAAEGTPRLAPVVEIAVMSDAGSSWHGSFFGSADSLTLFVATADPGTLLVVAGGVPYLVPVDEPGKYLVLPLEPVRDVRCAGAERIVLLAGYSDLLALGADGAIRWTAKRLASDGFDEVRVTSLTVEVRSFDPAERREVETTVDLATGAVLARRR
jgi:hypothetical protein